MSRSSRRDFLQRALAGSTLPWVVGLGSRASEAADPGDLSLIVRQAQPLNAEPPIEAFDGSLTPSRLFFVRSHHEPPAAKPSPWRIEVGGLVDRPASLTLDDLAGLERVTVPALLQCSGNGRAFFQPKPPGVTWVKGAVGNAEWSGVRLVDVLARAGVKAGAAHVHFLGADVLPTNPKEPKDSPFLRSIPLARALDPSTILATAMNGEALPHLHGGPLRLVVPTWVGNHWIKWLTTITLARDEAPGHFMQTAYRMPRTPQPPGAEIKPTDQLPVTALNVKSLITRPLEGATIQPGRVEVRGFAWTGDGVVTGVEVQATPDGPWTPAKLRDDPRPGTWVAWSVPWDARPGRQTLRSRATDSTGAVQPEASAWNHGGYLWNGIDRVTCEVR